MMTALYQDTDYKRFLAHTIAANKTRGYQTRLAKAAGCQKSFLSQVLNTHIHLTLDHAAGLCHFWQLNEMDSAYFLDLVNFARAGSRELKEFLKKRMNKARKQAEHIASRIEHATFLPVDHLVAYYSNWYMAAIHVLLSISEYQTLEAIAHRLRLPLDLVASCVQELCRMSLIEATDHGWKVLQSDLFLQEGSPLVKTYHTAWRHKAITNLERTGPEALHYTTVYAMSRRDIEKLREKILHMIEEARQLMKPSPEEDMVCFACDFFRV